MSTRELHAPPGPMTVALAQVHMVARLLRREFIFLGVMVSGCAALVVWAYAQGEINVGSGTEILPIFVPVAFPLTAIGFLWGLSVWRLDEPSRRGYFWSLPVAQPTHTLLRVAAGWVHLMWLCPAALIFMLLIALPAALRFEQLQLSFEAWWVPFVAATLPYLVVSAFAVAFDHPLRAIVFTGVGLMMVALAAQIWETNPLLDAIVAAATSLVIAVAGPSVIRVGMTDHAGVWLYPYLTWLAIACVATVAAAWWHRDAS